MSALPTVCAVCLTADRQKFTDRAVRCFERQTCKNARLLILDTGKYPYSYSWDRNELDITLKRMPLDAPKSLGALRNHANSLCDDAEIIVHWDSDDYSYPDRIAEQAGSLVILRDYPHPRAKRLEVIGSRAMWFWDSVKCEAWRYENDSEWYATSTSLCYWREAWQRHPFPDVNSGEAGRDWLRPLNSLGLVLPNWVIAEIHGGNINDYEAARRPGVREFRRGTPKDDARVRGIMRLA